MQIPFSRRSLFGGLLAGPLFTNPLRAMKPKRSDAPNLYEALGVRPIVNCRGTFTIISGSQSLPEVKRAMEEASHYYVHMDELMDAAGKRLAELTKADWGMVTNGCAAALAHATAACIAGGDPEKMQRMPVLTGLKNEVIVPRHSRNDYDHAVRMTGVTMVTVDTAEQFEAAFNPRTAMVMVLSSPNAETGPLSIKECARMSKAHNVPMLVDAAAEELRIPNIHLAAGATMVAYSGGKCMRGPQTAGLLLGPKDLIRAAWINSAPHHAFGRAMKVGKEEIMGMLAAVEMWTKRDHDAEWKQWESWLASISERVTKVPGVSTSVQQPADLSNHAPVLKIEWEPATLGITGPEVAALLMNGKPRITVVSGPENGVGIMPYMMMPGDHAIAADALYAVLSRPPKGAPKPAPAPPTSDISGQWTVHLEYVVGDATHTVALQQSGPTLSGTHKSDLISGDMRGTMDGAQVRLRSSHRWEGKVIDYNFSGTLEGNQMAGTVAMGEYGTAKWRATRA